MTAPPKTQEEWWANTEFVLPALIDYAYENGVFWDDTLAGQFFSDRNHRGLYRMFDQLWWDLPDNASMRYGPFFVLADLCSEYWVFQEQENVD